MAPIPKPESSTVRAIYQWYADTNESWDSWGISVGELGNDCDRALWYTFRWASPAEDIEGRKIRIFRRGDIEEERLVADLEAIGVEVFGQQDRIRFLAGHVRGKIDGRAIGIPEAPKTEHLCEFKSSNTKNFAILVKDKVQKAQPKHYVQCQLGMHFFGLSRALYMVCNKDDEALYTERVEYDVELCIRLLARAERLVLTHDVPARLSDDPDFFKCLFCKHRSVCHSGALPRPTCRSCLHATAEMSGDGHWSCARWSKPLSIDEQKLGCGAHLFLPAMVDGEQIDSDAEAETVTYRLRSGDLWIDGGAPAD